jgi:hypothetical protein
VLPVQVAARQPLSVGHGLQAPRPLQVPLFVQSPASGLLAVQRCLGSLLPSATGEHVPTLFATLQLMHSPPDAASLHALLQQTPSVQKPLWHCVPVVHTAPGGFSPHELFSQVLGATQSLSEVQVVLQALFEQMKLPQEWVSGVTQEP